MGTEEINERWREAYKLRFALMRGSRYYAFFDNRWSMIKAFFDVGNFVAFAASLALLLRPTNALAACLFPAFGLASYVFKFCLGIDEKIAVNRKKSDAFRAMAESFPSNIEEITVDEIKNIQSRRRELERGEIVFPCVSADMHNKTSVALTGKPDIRLSLLEKTVGRIIPIRYKLKQI